MVTVIAALTGCPRMAKRRAGSQPEALRVMVRA